MGFFGFLFVILLVILLFGLTMLHGVIRLVVNIVRSLFGFSGRGTKTKSRSRQRYYSQQSSPHTENKPVNRKKIFAKDEGEYVDFEEIKEP